MNQRPQFGVTWFEKQDDVNVNSAQPKRKSLTDKHNAQHTAQKEQVQKEKARFDLLV